VPIEDREKLLLGGNTCFVERWKKIIDKTGDY
jgi:hypothetical protein